MRKFFEPLEERRLLSTTYFVSASGSNSNSGTSASSAFATLQQAANSVKAGDTVDVEAGTYAGFQMINRVSGTASAPITFDFQSGAQINSADNSTTDGIDVEGCNFINIEGATITNDGSIARAGIRLAECDNFQLVGNNINGMGAWGIYTSHSSDGLIQGNITANSIGQHGIYVANSSSDDQIIGNVIYGNANCGIHINGDDSQGPPGIMTGFLVANNIIYDNGATGGSSINCDGVQDSVFENNLIYDNQNKGICLFQGDSGGASINDVVVNNTIIETTGAPALEIVDGSTGAVVFNNILMGSQDIDSASQSGLQMSNNITSGDASTMFVNASSGNYELANGSAAIGAGIASFEGQSAPTKDILGTTISSPMSIGAFDAASTGLTFRVPSGSASSGSSGSGSSGSGSSGSGSGSGTSGSGTTGSGSTGDGTSGSGSSGSGTGSSGTGSTGDGTSGSGTSGSGTSGSGTTGSGTSGDGSSGSGTSSGDGSGNPIDTTPPPPPSSGSSGSSGSSTGSSTGTTPTPPPPTMTVDEAVTPATVPGYPTLVSLSSWGQDSSGSPVTYTWTATGPAGVTFSSNTSTTANSTVAVLTQAGAYTFSVTMVGADGATATSTTSFTMAQVVSAVYVSGGSSLLNMGQSASFSAIALDQFGQVMSVPASSIIWSTNAIGSIDSNGHYVAPFALPGGSPIGVGTVYATINGVLGSQSFEVQAPQGFVALGPPAH